MWLGRLGQLLALPSPQRMLTATPTVPMTTTRLLSGLQAVQRHGRASRRWELDFRFLTEAEISLLTGFYTGQYGRGPWVLLDELDTNLLSVNQSSGGDAVGTTEGFSASDGTLTVSSSSAYQGGSALLWTLPSTTPGAPPAVSLTWPRGSFGHPVVAGETYCMQARVASSSSSITLRIDLAWYDAAGTLLETTQWAAVASSGDLSVYEHLTVTGTAPATAATVLPAITAETMVASGQISIDGCQLETAASPSTLVAGVGIPLVQVTALERRYDWHQLGHLDGVVLQEVG